MSLATRGYGSKTGIVTHGLGASALALSDTGIYNTTSNRIRLRQKLLVEAVIPLPTQYENAPFDPPVDGKWAKFTILFGGERQVDIGSSNHRFRIPGIIIVQLFDSIRKGDGEILEDAGTISTIYGLMTDLNIVFKVPVIKSQGIRDGKYWQVNVTCPFHVDTFESI